MVTPWTGFCARVPQAVAVDILELEDVQVADLAVGEGDVGGGVAGHGGRDGSRQHGGPAGRQRLGDAIAADWDGAPVGVAVCAGGLGPRGAERRLHSDGDALDGVLAVSRKPLPLTSSNLKTCRLPNLAVGEGNCGGGIGAYFGCGRCGQDRLPAYGHRLGNHIGADRHLVPDRPPGRVGQLGDLIPERCAQLDPHRWHPMLAGSWRWLPLLSSNLKTCRLPCSAT